MRRLLLSSALALSLAACRTADRASGFSADLRSPDDQVRCDAFFELFDARSAEGVPGEERFAGLTTREVQAILGDPNRVSTLTHEAVEWLLIGYSFDTVFPNGAGEAAERAFAQGWTYAPTLVFRDRVCVTTAQMARELGVDRLSVIPEHLRFVPGGEFP